MRPSTRRRGAWRSARRDGGPGATRVAFGLALLGALLWGAAPTPVWAEAALAAVPVDSSAAGPHPRAKTYMKRQWGVEVLFVRQASAGYMLEFRYKVLDPDKAAPLFDRQTKPVLIHSASGAELIVPTPPTTGALRNSNPPLADHTYWMFFANPGHLVKSGDKVTVEIGDFVAEDLVVR